ncbi:MAG: phosphohydrolase [Kiloniellales bacterium]|nr:phosphohydrolase [Kiloniellales bacterium]
MRGTGERSPLADPAWSYIEKTSLDDFTTEDWAQLDAQRAPYLAEQVARQALDMLAAQKHAPSFGYQINNYEHCLQAATLALRDGRDEETVVCTLFHDLGFVVCNETHGAFAATLLRPYVSERNVWMLVRHMYFQTVHCPSHPAIDPNLRERWRGHPHFDYAADWVARYDQNSIDAKIDTLPLADFEPMVQRVFSRPPKAVPIPGLED